MITLKKYLDSPQASSSVESDPETKALLPAAIVAYRSALREMGDCSLDASPALGLELKQGLAKLEKDLATAVTLEIIEATASNVRQQLQRWSRRTATYHRQQTGEVKEMLLLMAGTAKSVGERDQRCAQQINDVTTRLKKIANLEDLAEIRATVEKGASDLKTSIDRMTAEGTAALEQLRVEVTRYQAKLEAAEEIAACDSLTGLRSRHCVESQIESRIKTGLPFCIAIVDIDSFKQVNDDHGHLVGDELLKLFANKLRSGCRFTNLIGRWGGDEFIILLYCGLPEAKAQMDRLREWICGNYTIHGSSGPEKLKVEASIGLAEHLSNETLKEQLARADAAMYAHKAASRANGTSSGR